jgi:hypothetical protein
MIRKLTKIQNMIYEIRCQKVMLDSDLEPKVRCGFIRS